MLRTWLNSDTRSSYLKHFGWKQFLYDFFTTLVDTIVLAILLVLAFPFILIRFIASSVVAVIDGFQSLIEDIPYPHTWKNRAAFKLEIIEQKEYRESHFAQGEDREKRERALNDNR